MGEEGQTEEQARFRPTLGPACGLASPLPQRGHAVQRGSWCVGGVGGTSGPPRSSLPGSSPPHSSMGGGRTEEPRKPERLARLRGQPEDAGSLRATPPSTQQSPGKLGAGPSWVPSSPHLPVLSSLRWLKQGHSRRGRDRPACGRGSVGPMGLPHSVHGLGASWDRTSGGQEAEGGASALLRLLLCPGPWGQPAWGWRPGAAPRVSRPGRRLCAPAGGVCVCALCILAELGQCHTQGRMVPTITCWVIITAEAARAHSHKPSSDARVRDSKAWGDCELELREEN